MKKFIPDTDEQYSIDEYGQIWSHYMMNKYGYKIERLLKIAIHQSKRGCLTVNLGWPEKAYNIKAWMIKLHFNDWRPRVGQRYDFIDGDKTNCSVNNLKLRSDEAIRMKRNLRNKEYLRIRRAKLKTLNIDENS